MTNNSKIICRGRGREGSAIKEHKIHGIKDSAHNLFFHAEFHTFTCLTNIAPQAVELISLKFSVALQ